MALWKHVILSIKAFHAPCRPFNIHTELGIRKCRKILMFMRIIDYNILRNDVHTFMVTLKLRSPKDGSSAGRDPSSRANVASHPNLG